MTALNDIHAAIWKALAAGAGPQRTPLTMWQAATNGIGAAAGMPQVRTVVLRDADQQGGSISFHTDMRSAKVAELRADPRIAMTGLDLDNFVQIRLEGRAQICADEAERRAIWSAARPHTLILYRTPFAPGTPLDAPEAGHVREPGSGDGYANFCPVRVVLDKLEYLDISPDGHRRAVFRRNGDQWPGTWVAP
ncbi:MULTISPECIES: pyridoxamine 5'-phosphate oxidase family protein [unclassified Herbaspirillum]|uniref:pyridoxamine 5'-phosphate oxidase family protein n=1 Tax=unclassified Herbaspirillum TaxID=2624150 RepID=UPI00383B02B1